MSVSVTTKKVDDEAVSRAWKIYYMSDSLYNAQKCLSRFNLHP